jgi:hypothetical protein
MLRKLDGYSDGKYNYKPYEINSPNKSKSKDKKGEKNSAEKGKCSKCGK